MPAALVGLPSGAGRAGDPSLLWGPEETRRDSRGAAWAEPALPGKRQRSRVIRTASVRAEPLEMPWFVVRGSLQSHPGSKVSIPGPRPCALGAVPVSCGVCVLSLQGDPARAPGSSAKVPPVVSSLALSAEDRSQLVSFHSSESVSSSVKWAKWQRRASCSNPETRLELQGGPRAAGDAPPTPYLHSPKEARGPSEKACHC